MDNKFCSKTVKLGRQSVNRFSGPYVIAEIGVNHEGSLDLAKRQIELAKEGGADAAKFQTYKANKIASRNSPYYWDLAKESTKSQYDLFKKYDAFNEAEYRALKDHSDKVGIDFLSTPFDDEAIDFLDPLVPFFKIASADLNNLPLLRRVASKRKPVVLSTGASTLDEISNSLKVLESFGASEIVLMHCILNYPTPFEHANIGMIQGLNSEFPGYLLGYSDHTVPTREMTCLLSAFLLGAVVIEKHFTHDKTLPGNDHYHAMDMDDLKRFKVRVNEVLTFLGDFSKKPIESERLAILNARRSIVANRGIVRGTVVTEDMLTYKRPGTGISVSEWDKVIGKITKVQIEEDDVLSWSMLE